MDSLAHRVDAVYTRETRIRVAQALAPAVGDITDNYNCQHPKEYLGRYNTPLSSVSGLSNAIHHYLRKRGVQQLGDDFEWKLCVSFSPTQEARLKYPDYDNRLEPLLHVLYARIRADNLPDEIFGSLARWEGLYFMAGIYFGMYTSFIGDQFTQKKLLAWDLKETVARTITAGVTHLSAYRKQIGRTLPHKGDILEVSGNTLRPNLQLPFLVQQTKS